MRCKDKAADYIRKELGFNLINLPKASLTPGLVLFRNPDSSSVSVYGPMTDIVLEPSPAFPTIQKDLPVGSISGLKTNRFDFNVGLKFLKLFLSALGAKALGVEAAYTNASSIEFEYQNVSQDLIFPSSIGKFLRRSTPDTDWFFERFDEPNEAYIITDVIRSNSFATRAYTDKGAGIDINVDALKAVVGADSGLKIEQKEDLKISYEGEQSLAFGFKACPFGTEILEGKASFSMNFSTAGAVDLRGTDSENSLEDTDELEPETVLLAPDGLLKLN